jgi:hypothetical protein
MVRDDRKLDHSPEILGFVADLLIILGTIFTLGIFRC